MEQFRFECGAWASSRFWLIGVVFVDRLHWKQLIIYSHRVNNNNQEEGGKIYENKKIQQQEATATSIDKDRSKASREHTKKIACQRYFTARYREISCNLSIDAFFRPYLEWQDPIRTFPKAPIPRFFPRINCPICTGACSMILYSSYTSWRVNNERWDGIVGAATAVSVGVSVSVGICTGSLYQQVCTGQSLRVVLCARTIVRWKLIARLFPYIPDVLYTPLF